MTMSKANEDDGCDKYEPIRRLAMVQLGPARNPGKPLTSFCIRDILGLASMESDRSIHKCNSQNSYNDQQGDHRLLQHKHKSRGQSEHERSECVRSHNHPSKADMSQKKSKVKDRQIDLMNNCRKDKQSLGLKTSMPLSTVTLSNGRQRATVSGLAASPFQYLAPRGLLDLAPHDSPVNLTTAKIVRPWNNDLEIQSPSTNSRSPIPTPATLLTASEPSDDDDDDDEEEISVDDDEPPAKIPSSGVNHKTKTVSPLDALMAMTSKTFEGLEGGGPADVRRREQTVLFGKHQPPKKRRKSRTAFTNQQIYELEKRFLYQKYLTPADRDDIAASLGLTNAQVITWFQNRRAKLKRDLEELKNDVTAAKKLPVQKVLAPASFGDIDLRRVEGKRDAFNNGGLQSPSSSSLASASDETRDTCSTPVHSPDQAAGGDEDEEELISSRKYEEHMDTQGCDDDHVDTDSEITDHSRVRNLIPEEGTLDRELCRPRGEFQPGHTLPPRDQQDREVSEANLARDTHSQYMPGASV